VFSVTVGVALLVPLTVTARFVASPGTLLPNPSRTVITMSVASPAVPVAGTFAVLAAGSAAAALTWLRYGLPKMGTVLNVIVTSSACVMLASSPT